MFRNNRFAARLAQFDEIGPANDNEFVIPEDLSTLSDDQLTQLAVQAQDAFDALYGDGSGEQLSEEDIEVLATLTEGIESLATAQTEREAAAQERADRAAALAAKVRGTKPSDEDKPADEEPADKTEEPGDGTVEEDSEVKAVEGVVVEEPALVAAARQRREIRVNMAGRQARNLPKAVSEIQSVKDLLHVSGDGHQFVSGQGVDWDQAGQMLERRLQSVSLTAYANAAARGQMISQKAPLLSVTKPFSDDLLITSADESHIDAVLRHAADETRLQGNSLVAAGGWSAPSTIMYDLLELETRDGLFTLPEVGVVRGGFQYTLGPDFSALFTAAAGFRYTEADDIAGNYGYTTPPARANATAYALNAHVSFGGAIFKATTAGTSGGSVPVVPQNFGDTVTDGGVTWTRVEFAPTQAGSKPCYKIPDTTFNQVRLDVEGICITAGLLQRRGYPELIARVIRGALVAHDHRVAGRLLRSVVDGSDKVNVTGTNGAIAPLLTAIERQVESLRYKTRMSRGATMEAVFPFWVHGAARTDLANRAGVNYFDVTDAQIDAWFRLRGISPQFVYNWQDLNSATTATTWPTTLQFLLYPAGTWVRGSSDIITIDNLFDSVNLGQNNYTALFTEEGTAVIKRGYESRVVTVAINPNGAVG